MSVVLPLDKDEPSMLVSSPPGTMEHEVTPTATKTLSADEEHHTKHVHIPFDEGEAPKPADTPPSCARVTSDKEISPTSHQKSYFGSWTRGDWLSFASQHSDGTNGAAFPDVNWQWEHKTGWRDYTKKVSTKIEIAWRSGETKVRVQTGKKGAVPMEIFFEDMLQHDPVTGNTRNVQRAGPWSKWQGAKRFVGGVGRALETGKRRKERFADYQKRREQHHQEIEVPEEVLHGTGCCAAMATSPVFFSCSSLMVILYTVWLGVDADFNDAPTLTSAEPIFQIVENVFCVFFTLELLIRFCAFSRRKNCMKDAWFIFDSSLAALMIGEVWILPIIFAFAPELSHQIQGFTVLRSLRLARLARLTSLLRAFPEAMMLLKGIYAAVRGVLTTLCLLMVVLFIFGLIFKSQAAEHPVISERFFSTLSHSMWSLLMYATLLDGPAEEIEKHLGRIMALVFLLCIAISAWTVLNMLIGILCEVINKVSDTEKEEAQIRWLKRHLQDIFECYDANQDQHIGKREFRLLLANLEFREVLLRFGTDIQVLEDVVMAEYGTRDGSMSFADLVSFVLRLKGGNGAQVTDIADLRKCVRMLEHRLEAAGALEEKGTGAPAPPSVESIKVHILRARGLRNADVVPLTGKSDVYCKCVVLGKPNTGIATSVVKDNLSPAWNEEFVMADYQAGEHLRFQLFDQDMPVVKEDDFLGSAVLESGRFCPQGFEGELRLTGAGKGIEAYLEVKVTVKLMPESEDPQTSVSQTSINSLDSGGATSAALAMILARLDDVTANQDKLVGHLKRVEERLDIVEVAVTRTASPDLRMFDR
ncbi:unnamed protein product [Effrenium voratum]|nr:unnamed protein product [Effrenium voratum]